jgi:hypothetical protein
VVGSGWKRRERSKEVVSKEEEVEEVAREAKEVRR